MRLSVSYAPPARTAQTLTHICINYCFTFYLNVTGNPLNREWARQAKKERDGSRQSTDTLSQTDKKQTHLLYEHLLTGQYHVIIEKHIQANNLGFFLIRLSLSTNTHSCSFARGLCCAICRHDDLIYDDCSR